MSAGSLANTSSHRRRSLIGLALVAFSSLAVAACGGSGTAVAPPARGLETATPSPAPGASSVVLTFATPSTPITPGPVTVTALPTNADGSTLTYAQAAAYLPAAQTPGPDGAGTDGFITALGSTSITVKQIVIAGSTDSTGNAIPFVQNYTSVGTPGGTITVNYNSGTAFKTPHGRSDLAVGQEIIAGGTASGTTLAADFVAVVAAAPASPAAEQRTIATLRQAVTTKARAQETAPTGYTVVSNAFKYSYGLPGAVSFSRNGARLDSIPFPCSFTNPFGAQGTTSAMAVIGGAISLPHTTVNFPFETDYNPNPPQFIDNNGQFSGPGAMGSWLQFAADPGSANSPTYDLGFNITASVGLRIIDNCTGHTYFLAGIAVGYASESSTTKALPGPNQKVQLTATQCAGALTPVQITLPVGGGLHWLQNLGQILAFQACGLPTITGGLVQATVPTSPTGGIFSGSSVFFDPSMSGPSSVSSAPVLNPTAPVVSFPLGNWTYSPVYTDGQLIQVTLLGQPTISFGTCPSFPTCLADGTASGVPLLPSFQRTYTAGPSPIQISTTASPSPSRSPSPSPTAAALSYLCIGIPTYAAIYPGTGGDGCVQISSGIGKPNTDFYFSSVSLSDPAYSGIPMSLAAQALILSGTGAHLTGVTVKGETSGAHSGPILPIYSQSPWCNAVPGGDPTPVTVSGSGSSFTIAQTGVVNPNGGGGPSSCVIDFYDSYGDSLQVKLTLLTVEGSSMNAKAVSGRE
jgi:hypothetical protein